MKTALIVFVLLTFGAIMPYIFDIFMSRSEIIGNGTFMPVELYILFNHAICDGLQSIDNPSNSQFLFLNSGYILENSINSVLHTGVNTPRLNRAKSQNLGVSSVICFLLFLYYHRLYKFLLQKF